MNDVVSDVPESQLYYWSSAWQALEREAVQELKAGHGHVSDDATAAIHWLMSADAAA